MDDEHDKQYRNEWAIFVCLFTSRGHQTCFWQKGTVQVLYPKKMIRTQARFFF